MHRLYHQSQNVYHRVFPLLEIHSITSFLESQCVLKRTKSLLHNGCKWEHSPRYTEKSLWLFRHRIFVPVLNVSDVPPCGIVGFSEVEILVRFNTLWPSKGYGDHVSCAVSAVCDQVFLAIRRARPVPAWLPLFLVPPVWFYSWFQPQELRFGVHATCHDPGFFLDAELEEGYRDLPKYP